MFGTSTKEIVRHVLPILAAQEQGFWKGEGLLVEWFPSEQAGPMFQAMAAGHLKIAIGGALSAMQAQARGAPIIMVADLGSPDRFGIWVRPDSPVREVKELKGKRLGISRYGGSVHAYAVLSLRALGLEKEIKMVAAGGLMPSIAAMKAGTVEAMVTSLDAMFSFVVRGQAREILAATDYLPQPWFFLAITAHRGFVKEEPATVKKAVKGVLRATEFIMKNPGWSIAKIRAFRGFSEEEAKTYYTILKYGGDGRIDPRAAENVRKFLLEFGLVRGVEFPPVGQLFTNEFVS